MATFLLTWRGTGALDLSQVLDQRGQPVWFSRTGAQVPVHSSVLQHPFVKRYLNEHLLEATCLDGTPTPVKITPPTKIEATDTKETLSITVTSAPVLEPIPTPEPAPAPEETTPLESDTPVESVLIDTTSPIEISSTTDASTDAVVESTTKPDTVGKKSRRSSKR